MELLIALFFGIVQGLTEFLPISGGGHLALIQNVNQTMFGEELFSPTLTFDILLRLGTLMAIVFVFFSDIRGLWAAFLDIIKEIKRKEFSLRSEDPYRRLLYMLAVTALFLIPAVFISEYTGNYLNGLSVISVTLLVTGISNLLIDKIGVKKHTNAFFEQNFKSEGIVTEVELPSVEDEAVNETVFSKEPETDHPEESLDNLVLEEAVLVNTEAVSVAKAEVLEQEDSVFTEEPVNEEPPKAEATPSTEASEDSEDVTPDETEPRYFFKQACIVGIFQLCSVIPGLSRCSLTVLGGLFAGFRRDFTVKYAFLSTIPVLLAKILLQSITVLQDGIRMNWIPYLLGMVAAFVSGVFAIGLMRKSVRKYYCRRFGLYCLLLGIVIFMIQLRG